MFEEMKDVFELATTATSFVNELLKIKTTKNKSKQNDNENYSKLASSGYYSQLASSGYYSQLASSGYYSQLASSGNYSKLASSGYYSQLASSGYYSQLASSGNYSQLASSGNYSQLASSGNYSQLASSGNSSQLASSGNSSQLASSGNYSQLASSGNYSQLEITGKTSVTAAIGYKNIVKAVKGTWVTLAEFDNEGKVQFVKTEQIDGERLKEDCFYTLYKKEFQEVEVIDGIKTIILKRKQNVIHGVYLNSLDPCYVVEKDGVFSHGDTIKKAKDSLIYKISNRDTSMYENYTLDTKVTFEEAVKMYRIITGACEGGTRNFVENVLKNKKKKYTVKEVIAETQGQYGNDKLKEFFGVK